MDNDWLDGLLVVLALAAIIFFVVASLLWFAVIGVAVFVVLLSPWIAKGFITAICRAVRKKRKAEDSNPKV